jgi:hypothetical protein
VNRRILTTASLVTIATAAAMSMAAVHVAGNGPCGTRTENPKECSPSRLQVTDNEDGRGSGRVAKCRRSCRDEFPKDRVGTGVTV